MLIQRTIGDSSPSLASADPRLHMHGWTFLAPQGDLVRPMFRPISTVYLPAQGYSMAQLERAKWMASVAVLHSAEDDEE